MNGNLIGISTCSDERGQNINFAIPIEDFMNVKYDYKKTKDIAYKIKGESALNSEKYKSAIKYFTRYLKSNKKDIDILLKRGIAFTYENLYSDSLKDI